MKIWRHFLIICALQVSAVVAAFSAASAAELQSDDIIRSLTRPSGGIKVRGKALPALTEKDREFLRKLPPRGLARTEVEQVGALIDEKRPPSIDIEITFDYNSSVITPAAARDLDKLGAALMDPQIKESRIGINGHTDAKGGDEFNLKLSDARANAVRDYLLAHFQLPSSHLLALGFGKTRLKDPANPEGPENRRVEVVNFGN